MTMNVQSEARRTVKSKSGRVYLVECSALEPSLPDGPAVVGWYGDPGPAKGALTRHLRSGCAEEHKIMETAPLRSA